MTRNRVARFELGLAWRLAAVAILASATVTSGQVSNQDQPLPPPGFVRLNLEGETRLQTLIDYVSQRLGIQFLYSSELTNRTVNVRAPREIPVASLLPLLGSVLKMENLLLVDADIPGWKRIVDVQEVARVSRPGDPREVLEREGPAAPVTRIFVLQYIDVSELTTLIRPLGTPQGSASMLALTNGNVLVVTDYAQTVLTIEKLIELIDRPRGQVEFEFYPVRHLDAGSLAEQVKRMLDSRVAPQGARPESAKKSAIDLIPDERTNQILIVGPQGLVAEARLLLGRFDISLGLSTRVYRFQYIQSERIDRIVKGFLPAEDVDRLYSSTVDEEGNLLIARATTEIHDRIEELREQIDIPVKADESPIRFYKLRNANALDVLYTLLSLQELTGSALLGGTGVTPLGVPRAAGLAMAPESRVLDGMPQAVPGMELPGTIGRVPGPASRPGTGTNQPLRLPLRPDEPAAGAYEQTRQSRADRLSGVLGGLGAAGVATLPGGARVSADVATNSLVVYASPDVQQMYAKLIESLDRRRPQVLIEAEIVAVDTTDDFRLGVEISAGDRLGAKRLFEFTSFGLSEVDPTTGALTIRPSLGFNGTMVNADVADVVVQALAAHRRARVLASPRILVNDNTTGQLESIVSIPFQSVNASQTVSTTSLGGNQTAGTMITATPHINEDSHLLLEFAVEFSTFTGAADVNLPPPRQIDRVESTVTIPDGHTVIVGGLRRVGKTLATTGIPFVEKIPVLRELTSLNTDGVETTSFFLFIRPIILRDDKFSDLRFVSDKSLHEAEIPGQYPVSRPVLIED